MTKQDKWIKTWKDKEAIERRARLNELAADGYTLLTDEQKAEHDALAGMVAVDEEYHPDYKAEENGKDEES